MKLQIRDLWMMRIEKNIQIKDVITNSFQQAVREFSVFGSVLIFLLTEDADYRKICYLCWNVGIKVVKSGSIVPLPYKLN